MAALVEPAPRSTEPELCDLRTLRASGLDALLAEESVFWQEALSWDFENSASLVRKFVEIRALNGYALVFDGQVVGYAYFVLEDHKGLIGDLYVRKEFRRPSASGTGELRLLQAVLEELRRSTQVRRIESQLMTFAGPIPEEGTFLAEHLRTFPRDFLSVRMPMENPLKPRPVSPRICILPWQEHYQEGAAHLIAATYKGHVDSEINDQYRSNVGARKFLFNIIQYPGCGNFLQAASLVALDSEKGTLAGICLASLVGQESGHITQICVAKDWQGCGVGYELLRQSLDLLRQRAVKKVSLTVTSENTQALALYESMGFRRTRHFAAYVWEGF
jgi:ribosomal protein S18 acetylase RimI-like enzyme